MGPYFLDIKYKLAIKSEEENVFLSLNKCASKQMLVAIVFCRMSRKQLPNLYSNLLYRMGHYFLDTQYVALKRIPVWKKMEIFEPPLIL